MGEMITLAGLARENSALKKALAGHLFDGESVSFREAVRSELMTQLAGQLALVQRERDQCVEGIRHALTMVLEANESGLPYEACRELRAHLMGTITGHDGEPLAVQTEEPVNG